MAKKKTDDVVFMSTWEIQVDDVVTPYNGSVQEIEKKYNNAKGREGSITYLYRIDYNESGEVIEKYMVG
jgi:hypothetical protein